MVKLVHLLFFVAFNVLLVLFMFEVIADRITAVTPIALGIFLIEVIILVINRWKCPLTVYSEKLGSTSGRITDILLPRWLADRAFEFYGGLFFAGIVLLAVRLLL
jgi:hypothetical protein